MRFSARAKRQILKAQAEGQLDNLTGAGRPPDNADGGADAIGFRIMAEAGALPRGITLRKRVEAQTQTLRDAVGDADRRRAAPGLAELQSRLDNEAEARRRFQRA